MEEKLRLFVGLIVFSIFTYHFIKLFKHEKKVNEGAFLSSNNAANESQNITTRTTHFKQNCDSSITETEI